MHGRTPAHLECRLSISFTFLIDFLCARPHAHIPRSTSTPTRRRPHIKTHIHRQGDTGTQRQYWSDFWQLKLNLPFAAFSAVAQKVKCCLLDRLNNYGNTCMRVVWSWVMVAGCGFLGQGVGSGTGECVDEGVPYCQGVNTFGFCLLPPEMTRRFVSLLIDCWDSRPIDHPYLPRTLCGKLTNHTHTCHFLLWHFRYILFQFAHHHLMFQDNT